MPDGMLTPDEFEKQEDDKLKINIMYRLVYELYMGRRKEKVFDSAKTIFGGFLGGFVVMAGKAIFWK